MVYRDSASACDHQQRGSATRAPQDQARLAQLSGWLASLSEPAWLVGGALRDRLAGRHFADLDVVVAGDPTVAARGLADALGGSFATLAADRGVIRVGWPGTNWQAQTINVDIAQQRGASLLEDLQSRDFSINALALPLTPSALAWLYDIPATPPATITTPPEMALIDPLGGLADLAERRLRLASAAALREDPLRILRGARLVAQLGLMLPDATRIAAAQVARRIPEVAPERVTAEMLAMMAAPRATTALRALDALAALTVVVPPLSDCRGVTQGSLHYWDVFEHTLEVADYIDQTVALLEAGMLPDAPASPQLDPATQRVGHPLSLNFGGHNREILEHLRQPLGEGRTRLDLLKVAALFHDIGKPATRVDDEGKVRFPGHPEMGVAPTRATLRTWQLGQRARRYIPAIVQFHMRPGQLAGPQGVSDRALRHYFRDTGDVSLDVAVFSIADHFAVYGPTPLTAFWFAHYAIVSDLVRRYYEEPEHVIPARLIDGNDLRQHFGIQPGPRMRQILDQVHAARIDGILSTRTEALAMVSQLITVEEEST